jgi:hypothetical protein
MIELNRACGLGRAKEQRIDDICGDGGKPGRYRLVKGRAVRLDDDAHTNTGQSADESLLQAARMLANVLK